VAEELNITHKILSKLKKLFADMLNVCMVCLVFLTVKSCLDNFEKKIERYLLEQIFIEKKIKNDTFFQK